jgi:RNA polymerase sigma-70 factor (ECF subfamily)
VVRDFKRAWEAQDIKALVGLLDPDATVVADGGGLVAAALHPIEGADQIGAYLENLSHLRPADVTLLERTVNGQPGLVMLQDGVTITVFAFGITEGRITRIWAIRNPEKLRPWTAG